MKSTLVLLIGVSSWAFANDLDTFYQLAEQQQWQQAHPLGEALFADHAGEVEFDLAYAKVALAQRHHQQAIFSFERILMSDPGAHNARLLLADAHLQMQNNQEAEQQILVLKQAELNPEQSQALNQLDQLLQRLQRQQSRKVIYDASYGLGYEGNLNRAPAQSQFEVTLLGQEVTTEVSTALPATQHQLAVQGQLQHQLNQRQWLQYQSALSFSWYQEQYDEAGYTDPSEVGDYQTAQVSFGVGLNRWSFLRNLSTGFSWRYQDTPTTNSPSNYSFYGSLAMPIWSANLSGQYQLSSAEFWSHNLTLALVGEIGLGGLWQFSASQQMTHHTQAFRQSTNLLHLQRFPILNLWQHRAFLTFSYQGRFDHFDSDYFNHPMQAHLMGVSSDYRSARYYGFYLEAELGYQLNLTNEAMFNYRGANWAITLHWSGERGW